MNELSNAVFLGSPNNVSLAESPLPFVRYRMTLDFESYYGQGCTLSKQSMLAYITDPQFHVIGCSVRIDAHSIRADSGSWERPFTKRARWIPANQLATFFANVPWHEVAVVSHNISFDGSVLAWVYGHVPALYMDTLGMARALIYPYTGSASLDAVADYYKLPPKQKDVIVNAYGWTLKMFEEDEAKGGKRFAAYRSYCEHDTDLCAAILDRIAPQTPEEEILLADMVARMAIQPQFALDRDVLVNHYDSVVSAKATLLEKLRASGIFKGDLMSDKRLGELLTGLGVDVPMKTSPATGEQTYAFAKTDKEFTSLQEHDNPVVQMIVAARLGVKTTIEETRSLRFIACADVKWPRAADNAMLRPALPDPNTGAIPLRMPFPLKFSGAHTHRLSGDWRLNLQNLGRNSPLRRALVAPYGYEIVSADASQIEARLVCWLAGALRPLTDFRNKSDPYANLASIIFGYEVNKKDHPMERFVGKTAILGLGYSMGWQRFIITCWNQGKKIIDEQLAKKSVNAYRRQYAPEVPRLWEQADYAIRCMVANQPAAIGPVQVMGQRLLLPNGMWLHYNGIHYEQVPSPWGPGMMSQARFFFGKESVNIFGGKLIENIVQALSRILTMAAATRIRRRFGNEFPLAGQIHDQLIYLVPEGHGRWFLDNVLIPEMKAVLPWCPDIPLDAEGGIGKNLLECK